MYKYIIYFAAYYNRIVTFVLYDIKENIYIIYIIYITFLS